jgi:hypothetical protein
MSRADASALSNRLHNLRRRAVELEVKIQVEIFESARVVASTLVGSDNAVLKGRRFTTLYIDELEAYSYGQAVIEVPSLGGGTSTLKANDSYDEYAVRGGFFRVNYSYNDIYLLEVNGRYDGSSKFQPENRWDLFYGASLGWRIKQENFMQNIDWLSDLKLRVSYAEMGNQSGIANYDGVQLYNMVAGTGAYVGDGKLSYIKTNGELASRSRSWERIKNYNVGVDFGFLNGALSGSVEAFLKKNDNMLVSITYPGILGDEAPKANAGKFKDWGFEGQMTYRGNVAGVNYYVGGTFTFARNELVDYGGTTVLKSGYTTTQQG